MGHAEKPRWQVSLVEEGEDTGDIFGFWYDNYVARQGLFRDEADHERRQLTDEDSQTARFIKATLDGQIVGTIRVNWFARGLPAPEARALFRFDLFDGFEDRHLALFSRFIVAPELRGTMLPLALLMEAARFTAAHGIQLCFGDCEPHLVNLYNGLGFRTYGQLVNHPTSGLLIPMVLLTSDLEHLAAVRSPFVSMFREMSPEPAVLAAAREIVDRSRRVILTEELCGGEVFQAELNRLLGEGASAHEIFRDMSQETIGKLIRRAHIIECMDGDAIIRRGHVSKTLYIVLAGELEVVVDGQRICTAEAGTAVGEVAFFLGHPRSADVLAMGDGVCLLALNNRIVEQLIQRDPETAARLLLNMTRALCHKIAGPNMLEDVASLP